MRIEDLIENQPSPVLDLDDGEMSTLTRLGRALASDKRWWGSASDEPDRTAIDLRETRTGTIITVRNAIGVVGTGVRTLRVQPKIPMPHFVYIAQRGGIAARVAPPATRIGTSTDPWSVFALWFCTALRSLLRRDLAKGYRRQIEQIPVVRGRVHALPTMVEIIRGRMTLTCEYDEFDDDTPLNRILKATTRLISTSRSLGEDVRRQARKLLPQFDTVTDLRRADLAAVLDQHTAHYADAIGLARLILNGRDLQLSGDDHAGDTVLIRTPDLVEGGVRSILSAGLAPALTVSKRGLTLRGSSMTITPDLVFDFGRAVGDVKYQWFGPTWSRAHLYQATTFATAFRCDHAVIVGFGQLGPPSRVIVGDKTLTRLTWSANPTASPGESADLLISEVRSWLLDVVGEAAAS